MSPLPRTDLYSHDETELAPLPTLTHRQPIPRLPKKIVSFISRSNVTEGRRTASMSLT